MHQQQSIMVCYNSPSAMVSYLLKLLSQIVHIIVTTLSLNQSNHLSDLTAPHKDPEHYRLSNQFNESNDIDMDYQDNSNLIQNDQNQEDSNSDSLGDALSPCYTRARD